MLLSRHFINPIGIAMLVAAGLATWAVAAITHRYDEAYLMLVGLGPSTFGIDLIYRLNARDGRLFNPVGGGYLLLIPLWVIGLLWITFGVIDLQFH